jgi:hypothetical protein
LAPSYGTPGSSPGRYFAGGGGGAKNTSGSIPGGEGGGGQGGSPGTESAAGTANTGGGGGAGEDTNTPGAAGGTGIVAIRYVTACGSGASGGDASATCSSDTIRVFTGSGTFVP